MRNNFLYILHDEDDQQLARIKLPFLLNIGTQFEDPHSKGTYEVYKIIKDPDKLFTREIKFYCRQINKTPWVFDHLKATEYRVLSKSKGVNA